MVLPVRGSARTAVPPLPPAPHDCTELKISLVAASTVFADTTWFRASKDDPASIPATRTAPRYRFDCPVDYVGARYSIWYGARTAVGAMFEKFVDERRLISPRDRRGVFMGSVRSIRDLRLIDLRAPAVVGVFSGSPKLDGRLGSGSDYELSQAWGARLHDCAPDADGLVYHARKAGEDCVALFGDRIGGLLVPAGPASAIDDAAWEADRARFQLVSEITWVS